PAHDFKGDKLMSLATWCRREVDHFFAAQHVVNGRARATPALGQVWDAKQRRFHSRVVIPGTAG
ncbi:MAG TPA: hypothetical protein VNO32_38490, partial [Candidatus Acidoferrum sp.]|nr:hypothetical protein [Candidatus Acidoferrum sp.]